MTTGPKRLRLVLAPFPYQGHINPMLQLATFLHRAGFSVTVAHTAFNSPDPTRHPDFHFVRLRDGLSDDDVSSSDLATISLAINANCRASLEEEVSAAMARGRGEGLGEVVCIIHDELMYFCEAVANRLKLRSLVFRTTSAATCLSRCGILNLHSQGRFPVAGCNLEDEISQLHPLRFKDLPHPITADFFKFTQIITNMYTMTTAAAVIWNTMAWLEHPHLTQITNTHPKTPIFPIGPLHKTAAVSASLLKEDSKCLSWLDKQAPDSVIYVSLGSMALLTEEEVQEMAWGLANSQQPFLWVIRPGSVRGSGWFGFEDVVGERGCVVEWAPQREVLAHGAVGGFWSHCGWNSTMESLSEGVPMLCRPLFGDQMVNARFVSHEWRAGLELEGEFLERREIERGVRRLMGEEGKMMRETAMCFKVKIQHSLSKNGSTSSKLKELVDLIKSFSVVHDDIIVSLIN